MPDPLTQSILCPILIGRDAQVAALSRLLDQARSGHGQIALISGEAGIGKSRLVAESKTHAAAQGFSILQGNCFEPDRTLPYAPFVDLVSSLRAEAPLPDVLVALISGQRISAEEEPAPAKRRLFDALALFLSQFVSPQSGSLQQGQHEKHAKLLILEDLHWCDDSSLEFLLNFSRLLPTQPLCLLLTYRSDELHPALSHFLAELERRRLANELVLNRFTRSETTAAIRAIFNQPKVRAEFVEALQTHTDGNPFFVEETLKALVASGDIYQTSGVWTRKSLHELRIPHTVQDAVQRRTAHLSEAARDLLATAAVAGQRVDFDLLQAVTQQPERALLTQIKELIAAQLLREGEADHFAFRHALTRQAIYNGLLGRERMGLHRAILAVLEARVAAHPAAVEEKRTETSAELSASLAHHAHAGQQWEKSLRYAERAAEQSQALFSPRSAAEHLSRALEAYDHIASSVAVKRGELVRRRAQLYETLGEFDLARGDYESALAVAQAAADPRAEWENLFSLGFLWTARNMAQAGDYLNRALATARGMADPALLGASLNRVGNWRLNMERATTALQLHHEALTIFQRLDDSAGLALTHDLLGITHMVCGDYPASVPHHNQAIALYRQLDNRMSLSSCMGSAALRGGCYQGDTNVFAAASMDECWQLGRQAIQLARQIGWGFGEANANVFLSLAMGVRGEYARSLTCARDAMDLALDIEAPVWQGVTHISFGKTHHDCFDLPAARMHLEQALLLARGVGAQEFLNTVLSFLASILIAMGELAEAQKILQESTAWRESLTAPPEQTGSQRLILCTQAEWLLAQDDAAGALALIDGLIAAAWHSAEGAVIPRLWHLRGVALRQLKRLAEAEQVLIAGISSAQQQGLRPRLWRLQLALGDLYHAQRKSVLAQSCFASAQATVDQLAADLPDERLRVSLLQGFAVHLPTSASGHSLKPTPLRAAKQAFDGLTAREHEVAAWVAQGISNRAIAEQLVVSERTVEKHVENAVSKLGFTSRTQLAVWATARGLSR